MSLLSYKHVNVYAWATISGMGQLDITRVTTSFGVNRIPTAIMTVAVGTGITAVQMASGISDIPVMMIRDQGVHTLMRVKRRKAASIYVSTDGGVAGKLFSGYVTAVALVGEPGNMGVQISLVHWLDDLRATSLFSDSRTPAALWDISAQTSLLSKEGNETGMQTLEGVVSAVSDMNSTDVYGMLELFTKQLASGTLNSSQFTNSLALSALDKMKGNLKFSFTPEDSVTDGVATLISSAFMSVYDGGTAWESWLKLSAPFLFMFVPMVNTVHVVPCTPVLKSARHTLTCDDYVYISNVRAIRKEIAGLVLYDVSSMPCTSEHVQRTPQSIYYVPEHATGMLDACPLPLWLTGPVTSTRSSATDALINGIWSRTVRGTPLTDNASSANTTYNAGNTQRSEVGVAFAQAILNTRLFGQNTMQIRGPLRVDIAPGATVAVQLPEDIRNFTTGGKVYGFVEDVTIDLDSENAMAMTTLSMSHVRSAEDNNDFGVAGSPFYTKTYRGGNIIHGNAILTATQLSLPHAASSLGPVLTSLSHQSTIRLESTLPGGLSGSRITLQGTVGWGRTRLETTLPGGLSGANVTLQGAGGTTAGNTAGATAGNTVETAAQGSGAWVRVSATHAEYVAGAVAPTRSLQSIRESAAVAAAAAAEAAGIEYGTGVSGDV